MIILDIILRLAVIAGVIYAIKEVIKDVKNN